jgi:VCBS repeat-containing protein
MAITAGTAGPDIVDGTADPDRLYGLEDNDTLNGLAGSDYLDGGTGDDILNGGADDDVYIVDALGDVVNESVGQGFDIVYAIASYVLATGIQVERLSSTDHLSTVAKDLTGNDYVTEIFGNDGVNVLTGGAANNVLLGFGGNDTLDGLGGQDALLGMDGADTLNGGVGNDYFEGGEGNDTLNGGADDDLFIVDSTDTVGELTGEGFDIVYATTSYVLAAGAHVERLSSTDHLSTVAKNLTGNDLVVEIFGNDGENVLTGGAANNVILGFGASDTLYGLGGADFLYGMEGTDFLHGGAGNDYLQGGDQAGAGDTMSGGADDDTYIVYSSDIIVEQFNEGFDIVYAVGSYVLAASAHVEVLIAADTLSTDERNLTGNDVVWEIYGNNGVNALTGGAGASSLFGLGGDDMIRGNGGNDRLDGGDGIDFLRGDDGNDVIEGGAGNDRLVGGAGNDHLDGGIGGDTMQGEAGDDVYIVDNIEDSASESNSAHGNDTIFTSVDYRLGVLNLIETLAASDAAAITNLRLVGGDGANHIIGNAGDNLIDTGAGGADLLEGLGGADIFNFRNMSHTAFGGLAASGGIATIADFVQGVDKLKLDATKFGGLLGTPGAFEIGAVATSAATRLLYDPATGNLIYDTDGNKVGSLIDPPDPGAIFGRLQTGLALTWGDFIIVANEAPDAQPDFYAMTFTGSNQGLTLRQGANDWDLDGNPISATRVGLEGTPLLNVSYGLGPATYGGTYGVLSGTRGAFSYFLDASDPDTIALAPGQTVTEVYVYEITDGFLTSQSTMTISITRPASGAPASAMDAKSGEAGASNASAFAAVPDSAFAGTDDLAAAPLHPRDAGDYLVPDLWAI